MDDSTILGIKECTDCRLLIERDLGKARTGSKAWAWKCPMHHETKGYSLTAWVDGWKCWGACSTGGDAIKWLTHYHGLSFVEACQALGAPDSELSKLCNHGRQSKASAKVQYPVAAEPPDQEWQHLARRIVDRAEACLWSEDGARAMAYLKGNKRGLWAETIKRARLGYVPGDSVAGYVHYRLPNGSRFDVPRGIIIPWIVVGDIWGIKVRRAAGDIKYIQVAGSRISGQAIYGADDLVPGWPALFVEGEFDSLVAWQEARDLAAAVTLGSATNRLNPRWYEKLVSCRPILVNYDTDTAGDKGAATLAALTARARRIQVPSGKDVSEYHQMAGPRGIYEWLEGALERELV